MSEKPKILYIDDEEVNVCLFEYNFRKKFEVHTGKSAIEGLNLLEANRDINIIISDMKMPKMNGVEFATKVKQLYNDKKILIFTGFDLSEEIKEALKAKVVLKYFKKPYKVNEVEDAISLLTV